MESRLRPSRVADTTWGRALALLAVLVFAVLSMAGPGQTLCIGPDAHFAVESASAACCAPATEPAAATDCDGGRPSDVEPCHDPESDDGCTDVRLEIDPHSGGTHRHDPVPAADPETPGGPRSFPAVPVLPRVARSPASGPPPVAARPLVLRC